MIVDAHTHIGSDLYAGGFSGGQRLDAADRYVQIMRANGVDKGFTFTLYGLVQDPQEGNDQLARARDRYPDVIIPWCTVDPYWPEAKLRQEIRRCVKELGFPGLKFHPWIQGFSLMVGGMKAVAEECIDLNVPVTFHDGTPTYCTALQVVYFARAYPQLRVLSAHAGLREGWRDIIAPAKELKNYWICLSGPTQQGIQTLYDELGADRLMFGSDGGSGHPAVVANYLRRIRALRAPAEDIEKILGLNALAFLAPQHPR
jgi:predicted TIM-barrel fold metal-dependent hydrolase